MKGGMREPLVGGCGGKQLSEGLRVLAGDADDLIDEAERAMKNGALQRSSASAAEAAKVLKEMRAQAKRGSRQEQAACNEACKELDARLERLETGRKAAESMAVKAGASPGGDDTEARRKAAAATLKKASEIQVDTTESITRSLRIVDDAERTGAETSILLRVQTEQMKSIYADVAEMDDNVMKAKKILSSMMRQAYTDKITLCLLVLIVIAIIAAVAVKIIFHPPPPEPWVPPRPYPPAPVPVPPTPPPETPPPP